MQKPQPVNIDDDVMKQLELDEKDDDVFASLPVVPQSHHVQLDNNPLHSPGTDKYVSLAMIVFMWS